MNEAVKFSLADLRTYFLVDFAMGRPFAPAFHGSQLVDTQRAHGVLIHMDSLGSPVLRDDFVRYLDSTSHAARFSYERMAAVYNSMARPEPQGHADERMAYLHKTLTWWAFWRRQGMTEETFAERCAVHDRTVRKWLGQALRHVERELTAPVIELVFPASYQAFEARGR